MMTNLPVQTISRVAYLKGYLFLSNSKTLGFIDNHEHAKHKKFIQTSIDVSSYLIVQPVLIKGLGSTGGSVKNRKQKLLDNFSSLKAKKLYTTKRLREYRRHFNDSLYDKAKSQSKDRKRVLRHILSERSHGDLFYFALKGSQVDVYSQHKLYKSFSVNLLRFDSGRKGPVTLDFLRSFVGDDSRQEDARQQVSDLQRARVVNSNAEVKTAYFKCIFEKHGAFWSYNESMPDYLFVLMYNCDEFLDEVVREKSQKAGSREGSQEKSLFKRVIRKIRDNLQPKQQAKILTFELVSNQILSVQLIGETKNLLEWPGQLRFFRNFRSLIVAVFAVQAGTGQSGSRVKLLVKKFDKYGGFQRVYEKALGFSECDKPHYDILYAYKKNKGKADLEREKGGYHYFREAAPGGGSIGWA